MDTRSSDSPSSLSELLGRGKLGKLAQEAERRRRITAEIRARLPAEEGEHLVSAARTETGELVVVMDSAAWAARVRYRAAELGDGRLRVKVVPAGR
ncbi:MAG TPA: DciA family protein [Gammaproteobacteria bacterium]|nr:DciA family protein [Gammaproteobacteria bacterium]